MEKPSQRKEPEWKRCLNEASLSQFSPPPLFEPEEPPQERVLRPGYEDDLSFEEDYDVGCSRREPKGLGRLFRSRVVQVVLGVCSLGAAISIPTVLKRSGELAEEIDHIASKRLAIAVSTRDPDSNGKPIGYINGSVDLRGHDRSIAVDPKEMEPGGALYYYYHGLINLEDKGHDGGDSDWCGNSIRGLSRAIFSFGKKGGGSSIADQACGQVAQETGEYKNLSSLDRKLRDMTCALGLARTKTPEEIAAMYATFTYLAPHGEGVELFIRFYWGFEDIYDPRMTVGHQLILASLSKRIWNSSDDRWNMIQDRAKLGARRLINESNIDLEKLLNDLKVDTKENALKAIYAQIEDARPKNRHSVENFSMTPKKGYNYPILLAMKEAEERFGGKWREQVRQIVLTIDDNVQGAVVRGCEEALKNVNGQARCFTEIINGNGQIVAAHSGDRERSHIIDRSHSVRSPGSLGKIFLAIAVAKLGYKYDDPRLDGFKRAFQWSSRNIIDEAKKLGVKNEHLDFLIKCYGNGKADSNDLVASAALGGFGASPRQFMPLFFDLKFKEPSPEPHIVHEFILNDGTKIPGGSTLRPKDDRLQCYEAVSRTREFTLRTLELPLNGTLRPLYGKVSGGKTGTVGKRGETTEMAIVGAHFSVDGNPFAAMGIVGADTPGLDINKGPTQASGGSTASIVIRAGVDAVLGRKEAILGKLE